MCRRTGNSYNNDLPCLCVNTNVNSLSMENIRKILQQELRNITLQSMPKLCSKYWKSRRKLRCPRFYSKAATGVTPNTGWLIVYPDTHQPAGFLHIVCPGTHQIEPKRRCNLYHNVY